MVAIADCSMQTNSPTSRVLGGMGPELSRDRDALAIRFASDHVESDSKAARADAAR